jgi:hypothetical protein
MFSQSWEDQFEDREEARMRVELLGEDFYRPHKALRSFRAECAQCGSTRQTVITDRCLLEDRNAACCEAQSVQKAA